MMIRFGLIIAAAFAATLAGGCAATNGTQKRGRRRGQGLRDRQSHSREGERPTGVKATTDRRAIEDMMRPAGATGGVVGAGGS